MADEENSQQQLRDANANAKRRDDLAREEWETSEDFGQRRRPKSFSGSFNFNTPPSLDPQRQQNVNIMQAPAMERTSTRRVPIDGIRDSKHLGDERSGIANQGVPRMKPFRKLERRRLSVNTFTTESEQTGDVESFNDLRKPGHDMPGQYSSRTDEPQDSKANNEKKKDKGMLIRGNNFTEDHLTSPVIYIKGAKAPGYPETLSLSLLLLLQKSTAISKVLNDGVLEVRGTSPHIFYILDWIPFCRVYATHPSSHQFSFSNGWAALKKFLVWCYSGRFNHRECYTGEMELLVLLAEVLEAEEFGEYVQGQMTGSTITQEKYDDEVKVRKFRVRRSNVVDGASLRASEAFVRAVDAWGAGERGGDVVVERGLQHPVM